MKKILRLLDVGLSTVSRPALCGPSFYVASFALVLLLCLSLSIMGNAASSAVTFAEPGTGGASGLISIESFANGGDFVGTGYTTASVTALVKDASDHPVNNATVTWSIVSAANHSPAMYSGWGTKKTGLTWGASPTMVREDSITELTASTASNTGADGKATVQLTDIVGERSITIQAKVTIDGADHTVAQTVTYGNGPLSVFNAPDGADRTWDSAYLLCNGSSNAGRHFGKDWKSGAYVGGGKLPSIAEYKAVSPANTPRNYPDSNSAAQGAAFAAGWPSDRYWTGEAAANGWGAVARDVDISEGLAGSFDVKDANPVACRRYLDNTPLNNPESQTSSARTDETIQKLATERLSGETSSGYSFDFTGSDTITADYSDGNSPTTLRSTATIKVRVTDPANGDTVVANKEVSWKIISVIDNEATVMVTRKGAGYGLVWGNTYKENTSTARTPIAKYAGAFNVNTNKNGEAKIQLTDVIGSRVVQVTITVDGQTSSAHSVTFGAGPLSKFRLLKPPYTRRSAVGHDNWRSAYKACNRTSYPDDPADWTHASGHIGGTLPSVALLRKVSGGTGRTGNRAAEAAGWNDGFGSGLYWSGEASGASRTFVVGSPDARVRDYNFFNVRANFVCARP